MHVRSPIPANSIILPATADISYRGGGDRAAYQRNDTLSHAEAHSVRTELQFSDNSLNTTVIGSTTVIIRSLHAVPEMTALYGGSVRLSSCFTSETTFS
jgi:hypothetical protein